MIKKGSLAQLVCFNIMLSVGVIGLGYVGLPLAVQIAKVKKNLVNDNLLDRKIIGFDINQKRIEQTTTH